MFSTGNEHQKMVKASSSLGLQDFDLPGVIEEGSYAKVLLVRLKKQIVFMQ